MIALNLRSLGIYWHCACFVARGRSVELENILATKSDEDFEGRPAPITKIVLIGLEPLVSKLWLNLEIA
jgi:hypothetical protein